MFRRALFSSFIDGLLLDNAYTPTVHTKTVCIHSQNLDHRLTGKLLERFYSLVVACLLGLRMTGKRENGHARQHLCEFPSLRIGGFGYPRLFRKQLVHLRRGC